MVDSPARSSEDGFTVIEMLVAMTVLVIALLGSAMLFGSSIVVSGNTRNRVVAQQVASQYLEKARGTAADPTKFTTLVAGSTVSTKVINGVSFTVTETREFVNQSTTQSTCDSPGTNSGLVLRVREKVIWNGMAGTAAIREGTILAAPVGAYNTATGSIAVKVFDSTGQSASNVLVKAVGPATVQMATTPEGCAFFAFLAAGTYAVSVIQGTGVGDQENLIPAQNTSVSVGATASLQFNYDTAATINVTGWSNSAATPATGIPISVGNTGLQPSSQYSYTAGITALTPLFPYASGYTVFAGNCTDNNPLGKDTNRTLFYPTITPAPTPVNVPAGGTANTTVPLYSLPITVKNSSSVAVVNATVTAAPTTTYPVPYTSVCSSGTATGTGATLGLVATDAAGNSTTAMPLGHYTITATCVKPQPVCPTTNKVGTTSIWIRPDGNYTTASGAVGSLISGAVAVTVS